MSRVGGGDVVETETCSLIGTSRSERQPVKMSEYWSDVNMWRCTDYKTGCAVLDSDQPRESCNSQFMKIQEKQQEVCWHHQ